ncbi:protein argonaute 16 [Tanacetum coccineum]
MEIVNGEGTNGEGANGSPSLPSSPSPPPQSEVIELDVDTEQATHPKRSIISRPGFGSDGKHIPLLANHFKVSIKNPDEIFYQYSVSITSEDNRAIENKVLGRKILEKLYQTYSSELSGKRFAYDGEKGPYTIGPLPKNKTEFMVVLEDSYANGGSPARDGIPSESAKRSKRSFQEKMFEAEISYVAKMPLKSVSLALDVTPPKIRTTQRNGSIGVLLQGTKHKSRKTTLKWTF